MSYQKVLQQLKKGEYHPLYFLHGQESFFIDRIVDYIEAHVLPEQERAFNQTVLYGKEADPKSVIDLACRYPVMADRQVIILKEAQDMRNIKDLQPYLEKPVPTTMLVICYKHKKLDKRTKFAQTLLKNAIEFEAKSLYDNKIPGWIEEYLQAKSLRIKPEAAQLIAEYLGSDLSKVANELDKLAINLPDQTLISPTHVQEHIGISKDYNVFELQRALAGRDVLKANRIVRYFVANPKSNPFVVVLGALYSYFSRVYMLHALQQASEKEILKHLRLSSGFFLKEYRLAARNYPPQKVEEIMHHLKEYDLRSKGVENVSVPHGALLQELVWKILHRGSAKYEV